MAQIFIPILWRTANQFRSEQQGNIVSMAISEAHLSLIKKVAETRLEI
jgi:hypothetical protein